MRGGESARVLEWAGALGRPETGVAMGQTGVLVQGAVVSRTLVLDACVPGTIEDRPVSGFASDRCTCIVAVEVGARQAGARLGRSRTLV